jgi:phospholipase/carboxylesterase
MNALTPKRILISIVLGMAIAWSAGCGESYENLEPGTTFPLRCSIPARDGGLQDIPCLCSVPAGYTRDHAWPVVLALHGHGSNEEAFHDLWKPVTDSLGLVLITPRGDCPTEAGIGWGWSEASDVIVRECLDSARERVNIDAHRIYLVGFSGGGMEASFVGFRHALVFRGVGILGAAPETDLLRESEAGIRTKTAGGDFRVYMGHGELEPGLGEKASEAATRLKSLGASVEYTVYPGIGHTLPKPMSQELRRVLLYLDGES